ncbi:MAG: hypothetical protein KGJ80_05630 [Chloroflexota bacterium]|nr:hypothetical protein [Chloroflexota bacterium]
MWKSFLFVLRVCVLGIILSCATDAHAAPPFAWLDWAGTARIAGAFFDPTDTPADIDARLDALAAQNVSVVLADTPWGWSYSAWVDDAEFLTIKQLVTTIAQRAHARGLKIVMYKTGLELISLPMRNPGVEHPDWAQRTITNTAVLFNDIDSTQEHWLENGQWDYWLSPCSGYRAFAAARTSQVAQTGIDGLWVDTVYLQHSIGSHVDLWPSTDACAVAAFKSATGLDVPNVEDWNDPTWRRWMVWRHGQTMDYLQALKQSARQVNPNLVFFEENWNADTSAATLYANDPADIFTLADMSTGHEISTIADRVDLGQTGMSSATLDQWLSFRTMIAFARAADRNKPSWILTYGYQPRDSAQLAGITFAEAADFYETQGPGMAGSVGAAYRTQLFGWVAAHENEIYHGESIAQVGLLYSPRNRDLLDSGSGDYYNVQDSTHFAAYRKIANLLYRVHVPFDVVLDTDTANYNRYAVLIAPETQLMSDPVANGLRAFTGRLITIGENTGAYDEWFNPRARNALSGVPQQHFAIVSNAIVSATNTGLLTTTAPPSMQIGARRSSNGYALMLVNTSPTPAGAFDVNLQLQNGESLSTARLTSYDGANVAVPLSISGNIAHLAVPAGIDSQALLTLTFPNLRVYLPFIAR